MSLPAGMKNMEEFLAHALAIEAEAAERYRQLAKLMQAHHSRDVAECFLRLAQMEGEHHDSVRARAAGRALPALASTEYRWIDPQSPESAPLDPAHQPKTPRDALQIALANEERAWRFFERIVASPGYGHEVRAMAKEFAAQEEEHMEYLERMLNQPHLFLQ
jgi:rubrerythrin